MSYMTRSTTRSQSLKAKLEAIAQQDLDTRRDSQHETPPKHTASALQDVVGARVWQLMQTSLRTPPAGKKLKSLSRGLDVVPSTNLEAAEPKAHEVISSTRTSDLLQGNRMSRFQSRKQGR